MLADYFAFAYGVLAVAFSLLARLAPVDRPSVAWMTLACVAGTWPAPSLATASLTKILCLAIGTIIGLSGVSTPLVLTWRSTAT